MPLEESFTGISIAGGDLNADAASVADEIADLRRNYPKVLISTATKHFLKASYERTNYAQVKVTLTFPEDYPSHALIVDVESNNIVPPGLKKKLDKELGKVAADLAGHHQQVCAVFHRLISFVDTNRFVPCWRELKQCVELVKSSNKSTITIHDAKGRIKLRLQADKYYYACSITIDESYPSTKTNVDYGKACLVTMESTNFPPKIEVMLSSQAQELVRRMQDGMTADDAFHMSNPIRAPKHFQGDSKEPTQVRLTREALKGLKHDTETLKQVHDLRQLNAETVQGNGKIKAHAAKERKDARRTINKITDQERIKDQAMEEKDRQWQLEEQARIAGYNISEFDGSTPQPSLLPLVTFLMTKILKLPEETCPCCTQNSLPSNPDELKSLYLTASTAKTEAEKKARKVAKQKRPVRTYCGCWYHYSCLNTFMTEPPFGAACLASHCARRVYHPDWPDEIRQLERTWANKQARKREIEDAGMFF